jgi:hypothetical protein
MGLAVRSIPRFLDRNSAGVAHLLGGLLKCKYLNSIIGVIPECRCSSSGEQGDSQLGGRSTTRHLWECGMTLAGVSLFEFGMKFDLESVTQFAFS